MWIQMTINIRWFSNKSNKRNCIHVDTNDNNHYDGSVTKATKRIAYM